MEYKYRRTATGNGGLMYTTEFANDAFRIDILNLSQDSRKDTRRSNFTEKFVINFVTCAPRIYLRDVREFTEHELRSRKLHFHTSTFHLRRVLFSASIHLPLLLIFRADKEMCFVLLSMAMFDVKGGKR